MEEDKIKTRNQTDIGVVVFALERVRTYMKIVKHADKVALDPDDIEFLLNEIDSSIWGSLALARGIKERLDDE